MKWRVAKKVIRFKVMKDGRVNISRYRRETIDRARDTYASHVRRSWKMQVSDVSVLFSLGRS